MFTAREIRRKFLDFFQANGHTEVDSSSLVPREDPSLLFVNAGMVQFKKTFLGQEKRPYVRATSSQKCLRVSGKHNDLENVGRTARHHTFFEMLGNFSFGDYFKKDAIDLAWRFVTQELALPKESLYVTVFREDDEAEKLWQEVTDIAPNRIFRLGEKDNFWAMGDSGPCGPCSEIYIDQGADMACGPNCGIGTCDCDRFLEIWNLVFMQYDQPADGSPRVNLPRPSIDTGMGLERVAAVCQGKRSNFDCDLFQEIIQFTAKVAAKTYSFSSPDSNEVDTALRVIADHSRSAAFLIADGILPSNEGRGYVLRRLIRRALRFGTLMGMKEAFMYKSVGKVTEVMGEQFPELITRADFITRVVREEEERFSLTLEKGLALLEDELLQLKAKGQDMVSGEVAFKLYDTFGFPLDIVHDVASKKGFGVDESGPRGFVVHMKEQKERARSAWKGSGEKDLSGRYQSLLDEGIQAEFVGYHCLQANSRVIALLDSDLMPTDKIEAGATGSLVTGITPFYGASGGQTGDTGLIEAPAGTAEVTDTIKPLPNLIVHQIKVVSGHMLPDEEVSLKVTEGQRMASARNHTATHLLHAALRKILGDHVHQAGSLVAPDRLRFDFAHIAAMTPAELIAVEDEVNRMILADNPVADNEMSHQEALNMGAMALFGEKYGNVVRVVRVGGEEITESVELCGGTHLQRSGQAGCFSIVSETGIAAGVRRIEAATGWNALTLMRQQRQELANTANQLKVKPSDVCFRVEALQKEIKQVRRELDKAGSARQSDVMSGLKKVGDISFLSAHVGSMTIKALRETMDDIRSKLPSGVACLAAEEGDRAHVLMYVSKDLHSRFTAPDLIKQISDYFAGSGGGRPDSAQAGGTKPQGLPKALEALEELLKEEKN